MSFQDVKAFFTNDFFWLFMLLNFMIVFTLVQLHQSSNLELQEVDLPESSLPINNYDDCFERVIGTGEQESFSSCNIWFRAQD